MRYDMDHADTARWVTVYRAAESRRRDALLRDPFAARLAGERGDQLVTSLGAASQSWQFVVRTYLVDRVIEQAASRGQVDAVVNLGAGMDARPYRMSLPPDLRWFEVDLPALLEEKKALMAGFQSSCPVTQLAGDLTDPDVRREILDTVASGSQHTLVVTEGLLVYLPRRTVELLSDELRQRPCFGRWVTDVSPPALASRVVDRDDRPSGNAPCRFVPENGAEFFVERGWRLESSRYTLGEAVRLRRAPFKLGLRNLVSRGKLNRGSGGVALLTNGHAA